MCPCSPRVLVRWRRSDVSVTIKGSGLPGSTVVRAGQALPQTATATIFTLSGAVLVHAIAGLVTTATGVTATNLSVGNTPTGGASAPTSLATATSIASKVIGTWFLPTFTSNVAGTPIIAGVVNFDRGFAIMVPAGAITWTTSAGDTGAMAWYINYTPLDPGAGIT